MTSTATAGGSPAKRDLEARSPNGTAATASAMVSKRSASASDDPQAVSAAARPSASTGRSEGGDAICGILSQSAPDWVNTLTDTPSLEGPPLPVARSVAEVRAAVGEWRRQGFTVGFVPTMGALHEGHLNLVREAVQRADRVVASVFVNPAQFAPHEDLARYPRREAEDARLLAGAGCHLLFAPAVEEMYSADATTTIAVAGPAEGLEGAARPQMFGGVALVVAKLFNQVRPDLAVFGEKDWQQLAVVRRLVRDLDIPVEIVGVPTARDGHGLALSSRNAYLSEADLAVARRLNGILAEAGAEAVAGRPPAEVEARAREALLSAGFQSVDYVAVRQPDLTPFAGRIDGPGRVLAAAWLGETRLIDNLPI